MVNRTAGLVTVLLLAGCGGGGSDGPSASPPVSVEVKGAVQKGPFLVGSTVLINRLDSMGRSTSSTIVSQVEDSVGSFDFVSNEPGPVQLVASGYYFSELTGQPSNGTLTLRALYQLTNQPNQRAHVNMLTHLINDRALELIARSGKSFNDAITQAESELLAAFQRALPVTGLSTFSGLNIYSTSTTAAPAVGNAYLLALSTAFYKYSATKAAEFGTTTDAELTLILNTLSADLAADGDIDTAGFIDEFIRAVRSLSPAEIADNLRSRSLIDYPQGLGVPDISVFLHLCAGDAQCPWRAGAPLPTKAVGQAIAALDGKVYLFGGLFPSDTIGPPDYSTDVHEYDVARNEWSKKGPLPLGLSSSDAHVIGDKIFVIVVGRPGGYGYELLEYTPATDQWRTRASRAVYRQGAFASAAVNGKLYVIGGNGGMSDVEIFDPASNSWTTGQPAPMRLEIHNGSCVHGNSIYIFDPVLEGSGGYPSGLVLKYDTAVGIWSETARMREPNRRFASCASVGEAIYIAGGAIDISIVEELDLVERYDPLQKSWSSPTRLQTARMWPLAAVVGSEIVFIGGTRLDYPLPTKNLDLVEILDTEIL